MLSYTGARNLFGSLTNNTSTNNLVLGDVLINEGRRMMLGETEWPFLEDTYTFSTVASQQFYPFPYNYDKTINVTVTVGTVVYRPREISSRKDWDALNVTTSITSNQPQFFFIYGGQIGFWPIPSTSLASACTLHFKKMVIDLSVADYTTGTITTATNGSTAIVGTGTTWTTQMAGRFIRITYSNTAGTGDGYWYQIASVQSATTMTLSTAYQGTSIAAGTAAYAIGQMMIIPEKYQKGPVYYAAAVFWAKEGEDNGRSTKFMQMFEDIKQQMLEEYGNKTTDPTVDDGQDYSFINPNLIIWAT